MFRKLLLGTALTIISVAAHAADVDYGPPADEPNWAGLYIGAHAGYGWGNREGCSDIGACDSGSFEFDYDQEGWLAGAQLGYNFMPTCVRGRL